MKQSGGQRVFSLYTRNLASSSVAAVLALIAASGAKADVVETFYFSGSLTSFFVAPATFSGTMDLDFSNDFTSYTFGSLDINVQGRGSDFTQVSSLGLGTAVASIHATNSDNDTLTLTFSIPTPGAWYDFNQGTITAGQLVFGTFNGFFFGASGLVTRDSRNLAILAPPPPVIDPPPLSDPPPPPPLTDPPPVIDPPATTGSVPELSTWTMMLVGLAALGIAAKGRRAFNLLSGRPSPTVSRI